MIHNWEYHTSRLWMPDLTYLRLTYLPSRLPFDSPTCSRPPHALSTFLFSLSLSLFVSFCFFALVAFARISRLARPLV